MKKRIITALIGIAAAGAGLLYMTGVIGCALPPTKIGVRKLYDGPATQLSAAEDWPRFRGLRNDQVSKQVLPPALNEQNLKQLWAADVGLGYASPIAVAGKIYLFSMHDRKETLTAFDAATGNILWSQSGAEGFTSSYVGTRATPTVDGDRVYTYGGMGELTCRNISDGKEVWKINVLAETGSSNLRWGVASSPLVSMDRVFVQSGQGGAVGIAVDKMTGKTVWKSQATGLGGYAQVIQADVAGVPTVVFFGGDAVRGLDANTGKTIWQHPWSTSWDVNSSTPIYSGGKLFVTSEYDHGSMMLQLSPTGATKLWENQNILGKFQSAALDDGHLYANSGGNIVCVKWEDGSLKWRAKESDLRLGQGGSLIRSGDKLLTLSDRGKITLLAASPQGYKNLGQVKALEGSELFATPLLYGGRLYVKGTQELICFDLSGGN